MSYNSPSYPPENHRQVPRSVLGGVVAKMAHLLNWPVTTLRVITVIAAMIWTIPVVMAYILLSIFWKGSPKQSGARKQDLSAQPPPLPKQLASQQDLDAEIAAVRQRIREYEAQRLKY